VRMMFYLDILELCLLNIPKGRSVCKLKPLTVLRQLQSVRPSEHREYSVQDVEEAIRVMLPIFKNRRRRTRVFKITRRAGEKFLEEHGLALRPLEHARECLWKQEDPVT